MEPLTATECLLKTPLSNSSHNILTSEIKEPLIDAQQNEYIDSFAASCFSGKAYHSNLETVVNLGKIESPEKRLRLQSVVAFA